ncbi:hypothetical protein QCA50_010643 [Cerrena zonata]|uniref:NADH dehydrogenase subunit 4 n=1 Tax=Cerrena zonata TaxID=2478898 RepID=A0AAW0G4Z2_9APHY
MCIPFIVLSMIFPTDIASRALFLPGLLLHPLIPFSSAIFSFGSPLRPLILIVFRSHDPDSPLVSITYSSQLNLDYQVPTLSFDIFVLLHAIPTLFLSSFSLTKLLVVPNFFSPSPCHIRSLDRLHNRNYLNSSN